MATFLEVCRVVAPDARGATPSDAQRGPGRDGGRGAGRDGGREAGGEPAAGPIGWVRVMKPRVPAFDALDAGDLAIVPVGALAVVAATDRELEVLADGLGDAGVAGVLLVGDEPADTFVRALVARRVPVLVQPGGDAAALERSAIAFLVNRRAELDRQAGELERAIEAHVLAGRGPDALAAAIAGFVGRGVVIERRRGEALAIHVPGDVPDAFAAGTSAVAAYRARPTAVPFRYPLPGPDGRPLGSIVLLGEEPVRERERVAIERVATVIALALGVVATGEPLPAGSRESLPAAGPPWVVLVARQSGEGVADDRLESREQLRRDVRLFAGPDRIVLRGDAASLELRAVLAATAGDPGARDLAGRLGAIVGRTIALSRAFADPGARPAAEAEARATLEAVERLPAEDRPAIALADRLPAYRLLGGLPKLPDAAAEAAALLAPLLDGSPGARAERLATLRAVLDGGAGGTDVAAALGVHRNTVAYRLRRIEERTGWDLADPDLRLALAVALRIMQNAQV